MKRNTISLRLLGIGAASIRIGERNIYFDAFNNFNAPPKLEKDDIVLFSHDDEDHFSAERLIAAVLPTNIIIGPPSISYPLLTSNKITAGQLQVPYPQQIRKPAVINIADLTIYVFNIEHFIDWKPVHVSFLLEHDKKRIYLTGDSHLSPELAEYLTGIDCLVYSLLKEEVVKKIISKQAGLYYHISELLQVQFDFQPKLIVCNHLLNCDWTVDAAELGTLLKQAEIANIIAPQSETETINI